MKLLVRDAELFVLLAKRVERERDSVRISLEDGRGSREALRPFREVVNHLGELADLRLQRLRPSNTPNDRGPALVAHDKKIVKHV